MRGSSVSRVAPARTRPVCDVFAVEPSMARDDRPNHARRLSILIVTWRTPDDVIECVATVLRQLGDLDPEVIVVDNASNDGTVERLRHAFGRDRRVQIIANDQNLGYAAGNNQAYARSTGQAVMVLNPDVRMRRETFDAVSAIARGRANVGLVSCALVSEDGAPQTLHRRLPDLRTLFFVYTELGAWIDHRLFRRRMARRYKLLDRPRVGVAEVEQIAGTFFLVERRVVESRLDGVLFDESLPILVNDVELSRRVRDAGLRNLVDWEHFLVHGGSASLRQADPNDLRELRWAGFLHYFDRHAGVATGMVARVIRALSRLRRPRGRPPELGETQGVATQGRSRPALDENPLVSIVIPAYNYAEFLPEAIGSALGQTYGNVEVLVVDDGSTDATARILADFGDRIRVRRQRNSGLSAARNRGAALARGDYVVFLDADDRLHEEFVETCVKRLKALPTAGFAYSQVRFVGDESRTTHNQPYDLRRLCRGNEISACAVIRSSLIRGFPYDESNRTGWEDWDFWLTLAENGWGGVLVDQPLLFYRRHSQNMTRQIRGAEKARMKFNVLRRHGRLVGTRAVAEAWLGYVRLRIGLARLDWGPARLSPRVR